MLDDGPYEGAAHGRPVRYKLRWTRPEGRVTLNLLTWSIMRRLQERTFQGVCGTVVHVGTGDLVTLPNLDLVRATVAAGCGAVAQAVNHGPVIPG